VITVTRKNLGDEEVNLEISRGDFESGLVNPVLQSGDLVTISKAKFAYVQGEVAQPNRVRVERDLTLLKALTQVGGLTDWANAKEVQVLSEEGGAPRIFNVKQIQSGKQPDPPLYGGEIIVVKRRFF
jgi:protein involved in polysaccharide export with SLBB domain